MAPITTRSDDPIYGGHFGVNKTYKKLSAYYNRINLLILRNLSVHVMFVSDSRAVVVPLLESYMEYPSQRNFKGYM